MGISDHQRMDLIAGKFMLYAQFNTIDDIKRFWLLYGPAVEEYPEIERSHPWYKGLIK